MSRTEIYQPREGTLPARVLQYFRRLPDEELSARDIALKYSIDPGNVHTNLKSAVDHNMLVRSGTMYSAGPNIGELEAPATTLAATAPPTAPRPQVARGPRPDPLSVKLDDDVPLPGTHASRKIDWEPLLSRMQPGQSCVLPANASHTLRNAITARHKACLGKFTLRTLPNEQIRVWRTE